MRIELKQVAVLTFFLGGIVLGGLGCKGVEQEEQSVQPGGEIEVVGAAQFGSQCPYGSFAPPRSVRIGLWQCPIGRSSIELSEPLPPLVLQADCKKRTLDVRGMGRTSLATTWEVMPDGTFFLSTNAGFAKIKDDGSGNVNCSIPLAADMWGKLDCKDRDQVNIRVETVWWVGKVFDEPVSSPSSHPRPSTVPSGNPNSWPTSVPTASSTPMPTVWPSLWPSARVYADTASPTPEPSPSPDNPSSPTPRPAATANTASGPLCRMPEGCYFHNVTTLNQCE